jgi:hypothetical protein
MPGSAPSETPVIRKVKRRRVHLAGHTTYQVMRHAHKIVVGKTKGEVTGEESKRKCGCNFKMEFFIYGLFNDNFNG